MARAHYSSALVIQGPGQPDTGELHRQVAQELDAVHRLFRQWDSEASLKRRQALAARAFPVGEPFELALLAFNKAGERRRGARMAQDWFFAARHHPTESALQPCARCCVSVSRREIYFVDRAKEWKKADELCRHCMQCVMRKVLGEDDAAIFEEARRILDSGWSPVINPRLADTLVESRTFFSVHY